MSMTSCDPDGRTHAGDTWVNYTRYGSGYPIVMITGHEATLDMWDPNLIAELAKIHEVIVFDNRGMGDTTSGTREWSIEQFADDTAAFMDSIDIDQAHIIAWSMGTEVAFELALRHPDKVNKMVQYGADCDYNMYPPSSEVMDKLHDESGTPEERGWRSLQLLVPEAWLAHPQNREYILSVMSQVTETSSPENIQKQFEAMQKWGGCADRLPDLDKACLLVTGDQDVLTPPQNSDYLVQHIPGAQLVTFEGGGHGLMYQYPHRLAQTILSFLQ